MSELTSEGPRILFEEARGTVQVQGSTIEAIDEKAAQLLRFNALLVGLVATGTTLFLNTAGPAMGSFGLAALVVGLAGLVASTCLAILAFRTKEFRTGLDARDLTSAVEIDPSQASILKEATRAHAKAIVENSKSIERAIRRIGAALWTLLCAIGALTLATTSLLLNNGQWWS